MAGYRRLVGEKSHPAVSPQPGGILRQEYVQTAPYPHEETSSIRRM